MFQNTGKEVAKDVFDIHLNTSSVQSPGYVIRVDLRLEESTVPGQQYIDTNQVKVRHEEPGILHHNHEKKMETSDTGTRYSDYEHKGF